jgi:beta-glucanase (GH16 family)
VSVSSNSVQIEAGADGFPGINLIPKSGKWDLSAFGHVTAKIRNSSEKAISLSLRVDNAGNWQDNPWNTETVTLAPGETGIVTTIFGFAYGHKAGFALNPAAVVNLVIFTTKADVRESFELLSVEAGGPPHENPPVAPEDRRLKPENGVLFPNPKSRLYEGANLASPEGGQRLFGVQPEVGKWDLTDYTEILVTLKNATTKPITPKARIKSSGGDSDWFTASKPIAPGATVELHLPFFKPVDLNLGASGLVTSDAVGGVEILGQQLEIVFVRAVLNRATLPSWVGLKPPISGDWVKTLDEEFSGTHLDPKIWKAEGENYYDKLSHWSKNNVILKNGVAILRYEKKTGFQNDDPKRSSTPYTAGYIDSYGLWAQRYGYFEARMKVPTAPGLWPAFWMMPDRGTQAGEQGQRQDTSNGGMEFDIMEHLSRWGPYRFNIAMHYDGYAKDHKQIGSERIYAEPDKDGFVTCGLLWEPGLAIYYYNGKEVLRWKSPRVSNIPSMFLFTLPMGGWDNNGLDDAKLPADFLIDYVRVWQLREFLPK